MSGTFQPLSRWLTPWLSKRKPASPQDSPLPLGISAAELAALKALKSTPHWPHFCRVLGALAEAQSAELVAGQPHDRYLFLCGALHALRRVYTLADDLIAAATTSEEIADARDRDTARRAARHAAAFVNTPWWDAAGLGASGADRAVARRR